MNGVPPPLLCHHCYQPIAGNTLVETTIPDSDKCQFCCQGCAAAAALIANMGLQDYYRFRDTSQAEAPTALSGAELQVFSEPALVAPYLKDKGNNVELTLFAEGIHCAACVWLLEQALRQLEGVRQVSVNLVSHELRVHWRGHAVTPASIAQKIAALGYRPRLPGTAGSPARAQQRQMLGRLLVAGLGAMQAMMYAVALYAGALEGIDSWYRDFFRIAGLVISTPVVFYSGWPFLVSAARALKARSVNMDVPVSLALLMGWLGSLWSTGTGGEHVWFESISMFVFFLLVSRWLEQRQREAIARQFDQLQADLPLLVEKLEKDGEPQMIPARMVRAGDLIRVRQGDTIAVDGLVKAGEALVQEAVITGESLPVSRAESDPVVAGSKLAEGMLTIEASSGLQDSSLARIGDLVSRAQQQRQMGVFDSPRLAAMFVSTVLVLAAFTLVLHTIVGSATAFAATLAVLVVTCPCALAIAAPLTVAATLGRALRHGVLVADVTALARLSRADTFIFDKTGTLTDGCFVVHDCSVLSPGFSEGELLSVVAGLEKHATHPLASALKSLAEPAEMSAVRLSRTGVSGVYQGRHWQIAARETGSDGFMHLLLSAGGQPMLSISMSDRTQSGVGKMLQQLQAQGAHLVVSSGDQIGPVKRVAGELGVETMFAAQAPAMKTDRIKSYQSRGRIVAMIGDGVNDAGALLQADVGVAVSASSALARDAAHLYLLKTNISALPWLINLSRRMQRTLKQNFAWALGYNLLAVPFAMLGWVPPWLAALGMSLSSLLVTLNAARLSRWKS